MRKKSLRFLVEILILALFLLIAITLFCLAHPSLTPSWMKPIAKTTTSFKSRIAGLYRSFGFDEQNALKQWEEKVLQGRVEYWIDFDKRGGFVRSQSIRSASAIFYRINFDIADYPYLAWKWRVGKFPAKQGIRDAKKRDDFAARVYVIFSKRFFTNFKCLEYVWDESLPEGTNLVSPYSDKIEQLVIRTGKPSKDDWVAERRNVLEDFETAFGKKPDMKVVAIALMTDSEGTGTEAEGFFDDIQIGRAAS